ncbi:MAG: hypothetical protein IJP93_04225 [Bacteroidales bacterium]|nr:hypothetical protein [Bacteroidales bacterium]MBR0083271.1 hypothetical protein [Bacteroidales bacterium]
MSTATRIMKNSGFLYIRMGINLFISLYTTRLLLASLGASDFGIFNIVGGAIAMLGFLNSTLVNATQRFTSYSLGAGDLEESKKIFNISIVLHLLIGLVTVLLLLGVMYPLFHGILNIEPDRIYAAKVVYYSLIVSTFLTVINVPYDAVMNAHENMLYYSVLGVFEALLKLGIAFCCVYTSKDKLIVYGVLMAAIPLVTLSIMKFYCHRHYEECIIAPRRYWDSSKVKGILSFSGWNFLTAISSLFSAQGIGIVLNHFFGTVLNAAQGIAQQLNGYMSSFSANMMKALNPVIVKKAGSNDFDSMNRYMVSGCKFSALLIMFFSIPCMIEMPYVLRLWLKDIPEWTVLFCILQLVQTIIVQMAGSAATAVYAQGQIKWYAIWKSLMNAAPVILTYIAFKAGGGPAWLYIPMIVVWGIGGDLVIVAYAHKLCGLPLGDYLRGCVLPLAGIAACMLLFGYLPSLLMEKGFLRLLLCALLTSVAMLVSLWTIGVDAKEREILIEPLNKLIHRNKRNDE